MVAGTRVPIYERSTAFQAALISGAFTILAVLLAFWLTHRDQSRSVLVGIVQQTDGTVIPHAQIESLRGEPVQFTVQTGTDGFFQVTLPKDLQPVQVLVRAPNFETSYVALTTSLGSAQQITLQRAMAPIETPEKQAIEIHGSRNSVVNGNGNSVKIK